MGTHVDDRMKERVIFMDFFLLIYSAINYILYGGYIIYYLILSYYKPFIFFYHYLLILKWRAYININFNFNLFFILSLLFIIINPFLDLINSINKLWKLKWPPIKFIGYMLFNGEFSSFVSYCNENSLIINYYLIIGRFSFILLFYYENLLYL